MVFHKITFVLVPVTQRWAVRAGWVRFVLIFLFAFAGLNFSANRATAGVISTLSAVRRDCSEVGNVGQINCEPESPSPDRAPVSERSVAEFSLQQTTSRIRFSGASETETLGSVYGSFLAGQDQFRQTAFEGRLPFVPVAPKKRIFHPPRV